MDFRFGKEDEELRRRLRQFGDEQLIPRRAEFEDTEEYPDELFQLLREQNVYRYFVPKDYGGYGVSSVKICIIREELCRACTAAEGVPVASGIGAYPIVLFGSEEQKKKYLPAFAAGDRFIVVSMTEPAAGSDLAGIEATATIRGDAYLLNGVKTYVSNPQYADVFMVFAKTAPELRGKGISGFIVEKSFPGVSFKRMHLMPAFPVGRMMLEDCRVPKENLLGEENRGMRVALSSMDVYRTTVGAASVGMAQSAFEEAIRFVRERIAFERPLMDFQGIQFKLADMAARLDAARVLVYRAASMRDAGFDVVKEASIAKLFATENAQKVVDEAVQIHGGRGIWQESRVAFLYKAVRAPRIYEGTSEIQRIVICRELLRAGNGEASTSGL